MAFVWKDKDKIFMGEGVYHLTFAVVNRSKILGRLLPLEQCNRKGVKRITELADVEYTPLGLRIHQKVEELEQRHPELTICTKVIMEDHLHLVIWMHEGYEDSVKLLAKGFAQGCSKIAREVAHGGLPEVAPSDGASDMNTPVVHTPVVNTPVPENDPYDCGNGAHTLLAPLHPHPLTQGTARKDG